jgi:UDP-N-acetylglucosamine:LPS N-acetylglucosamine transferase
MGSCNRSADCILSKAGGLTVLEALECSMPLILIDAIPAQEMDHPNNAVSGYGGTRRKASSKSSNRLRIALL